MGDFLLARELRRRGVQDVRVLEAMSSLSRSDFVRSEDESRALEDSPLPIGEGQTISQPYIVAFMTESLGLRGDERVLEIGTGSGYQTAILAELAADVFSLERFETLAAEAQRRLELLGFENACVRTGDGYLGWEEAAPFDAILLTAAPKGVPRSLLDQLAVGGRLVAPVGEHADEQVLVRLTKDVSGDVRSETLLPVRFVPMVHGVPADSHVGG